MEIRPFRAHVYDEPGSVDGVVDASGLLADVGEGPATDSEFSAARILGSDRRHTWDRWLSEGFVRQVEEPSLYMFRSGASEDGSTRQSTGFFAQDAGVAIDSPEAAVHAIALDDEALADLLSPVGVPLVRATDHRGRHHRVWPVSSTAVVVTLCSSVVGHPSGASGLVAVTFGGPPPPAGLVFLAP